MKQQPGSRIKAGVAGNSVAATIFPRRFCRSILTQRPHFLGNSVALLHRDTLPRSTAEFDIGGGTRGHWGPVPPLMSREEAASYIGNAVAAFKIERQNFLGKIVAATEFPGYRISCDTGLSTHAPRVPCHALYATYSSIVEART